MILKIYRKPSKVIMIFKNQAKKVWSACRAIAKWRLLELVREKLLADLLNKNGTSEKSRKISLGNRRKENKSVFGG